MPPAKYLAPSSCRSRAGLEARHFFCINVALSKRLLVMNILPGCLASACREAAACCEAEDTVAKSLLHFQCLEFFSIFLWLREDLYKLSHIGCERNNPPWRRVMSPPVKATSLQE